LPGALLHRVGQSEVFEVLPPGACALIPTIAVTVEPGAEALPDAHAETTHRSARKVQVRLDGPRQTALVRFPARVPILAADLVADVRRRVASDAEQVQHPLHSVRRRLILAHRLERLRGELDATHTSGQQVRP